VATEILEEDPLLDEPENEVLHRQLKKLSRGPFDWSVIS
jgi:ATP-dependent DNA helicase RecG